VSLIEREGVNLETIWLFFNRIKGKRVGYEADKIPVMSFNVGIFEVYKMSTSSKCCLHNKRTERNTSAKGC
jgi:hypothetical protein